MSPSRLIPLSALLLVGCAPPPEAPTELEDLAVLFFEDFESDDDALLGQAALNLKSFLVEHDAGGVLDPSTDRADRTWQLPILETASMAGLTYPGDIIPADQLPVAVAFRSAYGQAPHLPLLALTDQTPIEPESSASYTRSFDSDTGCFLDGSCDTLECVDSIHRINTLIDLEYQQTKIYRRIALPDDGGDAILSRSWIPQRFTNDDGDMIDQWFGMSFTVGDGDGSLRLVTLWGASNLTLEDEFLRNQVADGIEEGFQNTDTYLAN